MGNMHELHQLLTKLVDAWPGDHSHPTVRQAREYLGISAPLGGLSDGSDQHLQPMHMEAPGDDQFGNMWYSV